jgi:hypothetical protein
MVKSVSLRKEIHESLSRYCEVNNLNKTGILTDLVESFLIAENAIKNKKPKYQLFKVKEKKTG